ncbi:caprin-2-like [Branchiostoma floridae]|uniref:Caprin-2-like n=1 Tax=Branchiostoma floridae TaxID=7739 RepID=A0A9J7LWM9_BRAFL|nr:caprin-2-like [Branchiostoma floridae]
MEFLPKSLRVLVVVVLVGLLGLPHARCAVLQRHRSLGNEDNTLYYDDGKANKIREEANPVYLPDPEIEEATLSPEEQTTVAVPTTVKTTTAEAPPTTTTTTQQANATTTTAATSNTTANANTTTAATSNTTANATTTAAASNITTTAQPTTPTPRPPVPPPPPKPAARVAFSVARLTPFGPRRRDTVPPFEHMFSNAGGAFCMHTSIFTAPVAGTYQFSWSGQKRSELKMYLGLYKNGEEMAGVYEADIDPDRFPNLNPHTASNTVIMHLYEKDEVTVVIAEGAQTYSTEFGKYTSFSGFLLFPDDPEV